MALSSGAVEAPPRQAVAADGGSVLTMAGRRAGVAGGGEARRRVPGQRRAGAGAAPRRDLPVRRVDGACAGPDGRRGDHGAAHGGRVRGVGARPGPGGRARARGGRLRRPGAGAPADAAAGPRVHRCPARRARSHRCFAARRRRGHGRGRRRRLPVHVVLLARAVVGGARRPRHLGRLRATGRRARSRFGRVVAAVRRDAAGVRGAARGLCRARGPRSVGRHRARLRAARPGPGARLRDDVTVYKAMGHIAEDAAAAELVYRAALSAGVGRDVDV